jgi:hypothetical protein
LKYIYYFFSDNGSVLRTCATVGIDDCKKANGVNYCYCSRDGCNTPDRRLSEPSEPIKSPRHHTESGGVSSSPQEGPLVRHRQGHELSLSPPASSANNAAANRGVHHNKGLLPPVDDEDTKEGSGGGEGGDFYDDDYYDLRGGIVVGGGGDSTAADPGSEDDVVLEYEDEEEMVDPLSPNANDGLGPDTEPGDGGEGFSDLTEPPPFLIKQEVEEELAQMNQPKGGKNKHNKNNDRVGGSKHKFDRVGGGGSEEDDIVIVEEFVTTTSRPSGRRTSSGSSDSGRSVSSAALLVAALVVVWCGVHGEPASWR